LKACLAVSFDVWGTLIDLEKTLSYLAMVASNRIGLPRGKAEEAVYASHNEARRIRRRTPNMHPGELIQRAKEILASKLSTDISTVDSILWEAFTTVDAESIVYPDVIPALQALYNTGVYMGVVGNVLFWPSTYTLAVLERTGLSKYFKTTVFSDNVGYSKPDRGIFLEFSAASGFEPDRIIHVGDNVVEDVGGALSAGLVGVLIDRGTSRSIFIEELNAAVINDMRKLVSLYSEISSMKCK